MKRRHFVWGAVAVATIATGLFVSDEISEHEIVAAVRRRLPHLQLDDAGLQAFAKDKVDELLAKRPTWFRIKYHIRGILSKPGELIGIRFPYTDGRSKRERLEDNLATIYLLSSDFFWNGADESQPVKYRALYDPIRACGNPFARRPT